ncbi:MAG: zinc ribbon domain-containing protein [Desulfatitalea sp.]|nr:zinc ribbon domain-containing protein [Desulfatitalea sp.]MBI5894694.1 zinc ribbon domain-containing protein [Desulfobacterales bacterium]
MPIFEIACNHCQFKGEVILVTQADGLRCPNCGSLETRKLMSATSSLTGKTPQRLPGPGDTACCGQSPSHAGCAGPGSCCGRAG